MQNPSLLKLYPEEWPFAADHLLHEAKIKDPSYIKVVKMAGLVLNQRQLLTCNHGENPDVGNEGVTPTPAQGWSWGDFW